MRFLRRTVATNPRSLDLRSRLGYDRRGVYEHNPDSHRNRFRSTARGKQRGHLGIPYSHNLGGWANLLIPICVIRNGDGPTVLLMAGNHGDKYPGQVAILKLWRELERRM
jgi:predicted deacylase